MVEVCRQCHTLAENIFGREADVDGICSRCGLRIIAFDSAYQCLILLDGDICIEVKVVADSLLRTFDLDDAVEVDNLVAGSEGHAASGGFNDLSGGRIERQCSLVAIFGREFYVILHRGIHTDERGKAFIDCNR